MTLQLFNLILIWIFFGFLASYLARRRGKNPHLWFWVGLVFGLFGVLFIFLIPNSLKKKEPSQNIPVTVSPALLFPEEKWYFFDHNKAQLGPLPFSELKKAWQNQELSEESFVWTHGLNEWKKVHAMPELLKKLTEN